MSYRCALHGEKDTEWCEGCGCILDCNHEDQTFTRFKDVRYDCDEGERTVTLYLYHCETCGETTGVEIQV